MHALHLRDLFLEGGYILCRHIFHDQDGARRIVKGLVKHLLALDRVEIVWQIGEDIVIDICVNIADCAWYQQQKSNYKNELCVMRQPAR